MVVPLCEYVPVFVEASPSGVNVKDEIEKLKAGTYDNVLMTSKQLENDSEDSTAMSPSM